MNQFEVAQGFIEQCQAGAPVDALAHAFQRAGSALGFKHFACCSPVDPLQPPLRERQCLALAAQGKGDRVLSKILGSSERTVHNHVENAKRKLQVAARVQAIVRALAGQQISFGDVVRCDSRPSAGLQQTHSQAKARSKAANL